MFSSVPAVITVIVDAAMLTSGAETVHSAFLAVPSPVPSWTTCPLVVKPAGRTIVAVFDLEFAEGTAVNDTVKSCPVESTRSAAP